MSAALSSSRRRLRRWLERLDGRIGRRQGRADLLSRVIIWAWRPVDHRLYEAQLGTEARYLADVRAERDAEDAQVEVGAALVVRETVVRDVGDRIDVPTPSLGTGVAVGTNGVASIARSVIEGAPRLVVVDSGRAEIVDSVLRDAEGSSLAGTSGVGLLAVGSGDVSIDASLVEDTAAANVEVALLDSLRSVRIARSVSL